MLAEFMRLALACFGRVLSVNKVFICTHYSLFLSPLVRNKVIHSMVVNIPALHVQFGNTNCDKNSIVT